LHVCSLLGEWEHQIDTCLCSVKFLYMVRKLELQELH
jgi:hypothetical protein